MAAACCGLAVLMLAAQPALAADDDDEDTFEQGLIRSLLGVDRPGIDYRERSPLVIPPTTQLPPPDTKTVTEIPGWPQDPDAARRKQASTREPVTDPFERNARPLSPSELRRGAARSRTRSNEPVRTPSDGEMGRPVLPSELGGKTLLGGLFGGGGDSSDKPATFAGEPPRTGLIEPPPGYRTPSPSQPYGPPKDDRPWYKPFSFFDRGVDRDLK